MKTFTLSKNQDPALRRLDRAIEIFLTVIFTLVILLTCCSCGTSKHVTQLVKHTSVDTVYLSNFQYDSIYIFQERNCDYHRGLGTLEHGTLEPDTLYIKDVSIEYRYKMLRDTILKVQHDSIPFEVTKVVTKEIQRPLTWYDKLTRLTFWFVFGYLISLIIFKLKSVIPHL